MIYLITGVPGSGKTLYAVSTLVQKLAAEKIKNADGSETDRRVVVDGIPDLIFPHEMMAKHQENTSTEKRGDGDGLWNWFDWCKPGDVLVVDEVQRHWRPRGMGTKPPKEISMLETHRHLGVDFVLITQNPMLIDQNVRRLIGRHQHIRRLFGMPRAVIYDWDGCSVDVHRTKSATTSYWAYPKSAYKLYKSAELHTKQKQKIPVWLVVPFAAIIGGAFIAPTAFATLSGAATGKGIPSSTAKPLTGGESVSIPLPVVPSSVPGHKPDISVPVAVQQQVDLTMPEGVAGCVVVKSRCGCFDQTGKKIEVVYPVCVNHVSPDPSEPAQIAVDRPAAGQGLFVPDAFAYTNNPQDVEVLSDLRSDRQRGHKRTD